MTGENVSNIGPLSRAAQYLVISNRNSILSPEARKKKLETMRSGKLLKALYPLKFTGAWLYCFGALFKAPALCFLGDRVVEDHASRVIRNSLDRYLNTNSERQLEYLKPKKILVLSVFLQSFKELHRAYSTSEMNHFSEYARVLTLFRYYILWKAMFLTKQPENSLLASTNDQKRIALGVVSEEGKIPVVAYTVHRAELRPPAPFKIDTQFCWTTQQQQHLEKQGIEAVLMPVPEVRKINLALKPADNALCGFLLNAKCDARKVQNFVTKLRTAYGINKIRVRPHPGFDTVQLDFGSEAEVCDWKESLWNYLDSVEMVFALNTNAIIDALLHGVPVVYVGYLDNLDYDLQGFVRDGIVLPFDDGFSYPDSIIAFYSSDDFASKWNSELFTTNGEPEANALQALGI